jgi:flagellar protein FliO/FliZ
MRIPAILLAACLLPLPLGEGRGEGLPGRTGSYYQTAPQSPPQQVTGSAARAPLKLAPRSATTQPGLAKPATPAPASALGTVLGSLGIVLGLFFTFVWFSRRFAPTGSSQLPKEAVETLGRAPLSSKQQLQLLRVGNKLLLVAHSPAGVETLTEITDSAEVEQLTALCRRGQSGSSSAAFRQVLNQIAAEPAPGGFVGPSRRETRGAR